ncbi:hypothetical protein FRC04_010542 [Tulasnella sp. 424]|nr:hypothetical protein FRC04_010542 [Tulasnella sp. 424]
MTGGVPSSQNPSPRSSQSHSNALAVYRPLPSTPEARPIIAGLMAFQALTANRKRIQRDSSGIYAIDWEWYIKDLGKRKHAFTQITDVLFALCSYLELTTDATVILYCARAERSPTDLTIGRSEAIYANCRGREGPTGAHLYNSTVQAARAFADTLSAEWYSRQSAYDSAARQAVKKSIDRHEKFHPTGDYPALCRIDSDAADLFVDALCDFDWSSLGLDAPRCAAPIAFPSYGSVPVDPLAIQSTRLNVSTSTTLSSVEAYADEEHPHPEPRSSASSFPIRRCATPAELEYMQGCGLSELQQAQIRLAVWEEDPNDWHDVFRSIIGDKPSVVYGTLGMFSRPGM